MVRPLGAGGMAVVLLAWDLELDRAVALKLYDHDIQDAARSRTHHEARAMAALAHPNVTTIYGLGLHGTRLYIAMEFVDGGTLGAWLRRERPGPRRVVDVFVACADGLAAAHAAGIVHGDIKPSNILVDLDGRPRIADFGLSRATRSDGDSIAPPGFFGTLRYAAPEQLGGEEIDVRADQFALCVTLYEALHGEHPFVGDDSEAIATAILGGARRRRRSGAVVTPGVTRAIERGLAQSPGERYAGMHELAAALRRAPWRRRFWWLLGGAATVGLVAASLQREGGCGTAESAMDEVWNEDRKAEMSAAFAGSDAPFFGELLDATTTSIDAWTDAWRSERRDACVAMSTNAQMDTEVGAQRIRCLEHQRLALSAVIDALDHADRETVTRAPDVVARLRDPRSCRLPDPSDTAAPQDPEHFAAEREQLARASAALELGRHDESAELALGVVRRTAQDLPALHAEAALLLGLARSGAAEFDAADTALGDAFHGAMAIGNDAIAASAAIELVCVLPHVRRGNARAPQWLRAAVAISRRRGISEPDELRLELCRGGLLLGEAQPRDAERVYRDALATTTTRTDPLIVARLHAGIGNALFDRGSFVESLAAYDRAVATMGATNRARRADGLAIHIGRAEVLTRMGRAGDGLAALLECLRDAIVALGSDAAALPKIYDGIAASLLVLNAPA
ncbi:MAG TPA: serine/threonine-protein kinase, partial [Nannocystaceae bacterium]|nr:serine/threonine-protein kinase [Nannocystaceae bacterium]